VNFPDQILRNLFQASLGASALAPLASKLCHCAQTSSSGEKSFGEK